MYTFIRKVKFIFKLFRMTQMDCLQDGILILVFEFYSCTEMIQNTVNIIEILRSLDNWYGFSILGT